METGLRDLDPWQTTQIPDGFRAAKIEFSTATGLERVHPGAQLDDPGIAWVWDELETRGLTLTLDLGAIGAPSYQTSAVRAIAKNHPRLKIVVCHLAQPSPAIARDERLFARWREQIDLGRLPNVWFDTASLPAYFLHLSAIPADLKLRLHSNFRLRLRASG